MLPVLNRPHIDMLPEMLDADDKIDADDEITDLEDLDLICSLIRLERKLVKFPITSDYCRITFRDLVENFSRRQISDLLHIVPFLFPENYDNNQ